MALQKFFQDYMSHFKGDLGKSRDIGIGAYASQLNHREGDVALGLCYLSFITDPLFVYFQEEVRYECQILR